MPTHAELATSNPQEPNTSVWPDRLLAHLPLGEPCDLDEIAERSGLTPARLLPALFELELRGCVRRAGAGRFVRFDGRVRF